MGRPLAVRCARRSWMRGGTPAIAGTALALTLLLLPAPGAASPESDRPLTVSVGAGYRIHNEHLGLEDAFAFGGRLGMGLSPRVEIALDYTGSIGDRETTDALAGVDLLRALVRWNALTGSVRPYALGGAGMVLVDFSDAADYASYAMTVGAGVEQALPHAFVLRLEGVLDFSRASRVRYDSTGEVVEQESATTDGIGTFTLSLGARF
jgi:opacity protein-like surface antigen